MVIAQYIKDLETYIIMVAFKWILYYHITSLSLLDAIVMVVHWETSHYTAGVRHNDGRNQFHAHIDTCMHFIPQHAMA